MDRFQAKLLLFTLFFIANISIVQAMDICQAVLNTPLDLYNSTIKSNVKSAILDKFCGIQWSNQSDLRRNAEAIDTGGNYMDVYSGFLKASKNTDESSLRQAFSSICNDYNSSYANEMFATDNRQSSDEIVQAWRKCAERQQGLFSAVRSVEDSRDFKIEVSYKTNENSPPPLIIKSPSDGSGYHCSLNGKELANLNATAAGVASDFVLDCQKTSATSIIVALNTSKGAIGPFDIGGEILARTNERIDTLERDITGLQQLVKTQQEQLKGIQGGHFKVVTGTMVDVDKSGGHATVGSAQCVDGTEMGYGITGWGVTVPGGDLRQMIVMGDGHPDPNDPHTLVLRALNQADPGRGKVQFYGLCVFH